GQIFFTLSVGMGSIQCYASYIKKRDDIALNAMAAGWMNEFVEIVLGSAVIIPISIGYLGIDKVIELTGIGGLGLGFRTMPFLFEQWGPILSAIAGVSFFGLLFFAGITSSLAMGTPGMGFLMDEFNWSRKNAALGFGLVIMILGLPTIFFFNQGVFDEYDYWGGTVSLVVFALLESILFSWVFGLKKGWKEINMGADIKIPLVYRFIIKFITPMMLIVVFFGSLVRPVNDDWTGQKIGQWEFHNESIIGQLKHQGIGPNKLWFADAFYSENTGKVDSIFLLRKKHYISVGYRLGDETVNSQNYRYMPLKHTLSIKSGDEVVKGDVLFTGKIINKVFYIDMARLLLMSLFVFIAILVYIAWRKYHQPQKTP
ncbi:MAG TPA: sodium:calcium symporter, partial [Bacteroidales bacterium]|nr:sodium:calcium symporter [Bacteroidales bacterium]